MSLFGILEKSARTRKGRFDCVSFVGRCAAGCSRRHWWAIAALPGSWNPLTEWRGGPGARPPPLPLEI